MKCFWCAAINQFKRSHFGNLLFLMWSQTQVSAMKINDKWIINLLSCPKNLYRWRNAALILTAMCYPYSICCILQHSTVRLMSRWQQTSLLANPRITVTWTLVKDATFWSLFSLPSLLCCTDAGFEQFRVAEKAHGNWMKLYLEGNTSEVLTNMGKKVLKQYLEALAAMSSALSKQLGKYDMYSMIAGMVFVFQVSRALLFYLFNPRFKGTIK